MPEDFERDLPSFTSFLRRIQVGTTLGYKAESAETPAETPALSEPPGPAPEEPPALPAPSVAAPAASGPPPTAPAPAASVTP